MIRHYQDMVNQQRRSGIDIPVSVKTRTMLGIISACDEILDAREGICYALGEHADEEVA